MSSCENPVWWDSDIDGMGRPIRPDVRAAAHEIWACACRRAQSAISDCSQAADLMENTVAQISQYLDQRCVGVFSREIRGLLMHAFQKALQHRVSKLNRLETVGGAEELSSRAVDRTWVRQVHAQLEFEQIVGMLCERSRTILALRCAGFTWKEAAQTLRTSVSASRSGFWRDVARVKRELDNHRSVKPERGVQKEGQDLIAVINDSLH
jgi:hypothetical protein